MDLEKIIGIEKPDKIFNPSYEDGVYYILDKNLTQALIGDYVFPLKYLDYLEGGLLATAIVISSLACYLGIRKNDK